MTTTVNEIFIHITFTILHITFVHKTLRVAHLHAKYYDTRRNSLFYSMSNYQLYYVRYLCVRYLFQMFMKTLLAYVRRPLWVGVETWWGRMCN